MQEYINILSIGFSVVFLTSLILALYLFGTTQRWVKYGPNGKALLITWAIFGVMYYLVQIAISNFPFWVDLGMLAAHALVVSTLVRNSQENFKKRSTP